MSSRVLEKAFEIYLRMLNNWQNPPEGTPVEAIPAIQMNTELVNGVPRNSPDINNKKIPPPYSIFWNIAYTIAEKLDIYRNL